MDRASDDESYQIRATLLGLGLDANQPDDHVDWLVHTMASDWSMVSKEQKKVGGNLDSFVRASWVAYWVTKTQK